jgi:hypothetical protein
MLEMCVAMQATPALNKMNAEAAFPRIWKNDDIL